MTDKPLTVVAIIPARGGSKGIPRKNLKLVAGKPLIAWAIEESRRANLVDRVIVSTDDADIKATSLRYGAEVVDRPHEISEDFSSSEEALLHVVEFLRLSQSFQPEIVVLIQCTSPLTIAEDIDGTIQALLDENADSALAVTDFHYFLWEKGKTGEAVGINHDKRVRPLRQSREPQFIETGAVYAMRTHGLIEAKHRFFGKTALYHMPLERRLEIDDPIDLWFANLLLQERQEQRTVKALPPDVRLLVLDFDGVLTDNKVLVLEDGREAVVCDRGDGMGLSSVKREGIDVAVLSTEVNQVVTARCQKLGIEHKQGLEDKAEALQELAEKKGVAMSQVVYVGNDINDLGCLRLAGCAVVVADAHPAALAVADLVLSRPGGHGAVRELCDMIISPETR